jgi:hypothetical protein
MGAYLGGARRRLVADRQATNDDRRGSPHVRRVSWLRWLPLALVTLVSSGCVLTSPAAADSATIVAPSQLVPGHTVRLQLSGFPAGDRIYVQLGVVTKRPDRRCRGLTRNDCLERCVRLRRGFVEASMDHHGYAQAVREEVRGDLTPPRRAHEPAGGRYRVCRPVGADRL